MPSATLHSFYNWWDATGTYPTDVSDGFGHGTFVTGIMVGDDGGTNQIGMAPGAQTIIALEFTCLGAPDIEVTPPSLVATLCPDTNEARNLSIGNVGTETLTWELRERPQRAGLAAPPVDMSISPGGVHLAGDEPASMGHALAANLPPGACGLAGRLSHSAPKINPWPSADEAAGPLSRPASRFGYAVEVYPGTNLIRFDLDEPGSWTIIAPLPGSSYSGGDFRGYDFSSLYAVDTALNQLHTIDTAAGAVTVIGPAAPGGDESWTGLGGAPDGTLYGSATTCGSSTLYTLDPETGAATAVDPINGACVIGIAVNSGGQIYGIDIVTDGLLQIDPATGAGTVIGSLGVNANHAQSIDFEEESGDLFWAA